MFEVGDIVHMKFGGSRGEFYIMEIGEGFVRFCSPQWLTSSAEWEAIGDFKKRDPIFISRGKRSIISFVPIIGCLFPRYKRK